MNISDVRNVNFHPNKLLRFVRKLQWYFLVYLPARHDVTIITRNGVLTFNSRDRTTGRNLYVYRNHEFDYMLLFVEMLRKEGYLSSACDGTVLDVGGYIGMSSTAFLLENIFHKAVAFEPSPENYRLLQINIRDNGLDDRLIAHNLALSDANGTLDFELSKKNYGDHRIRKPGESTIGFYNEQDRQVIRVHARKFDELSEEKIGVAFTTIKLIWMDVQGHEARFIKGAYQFLKSHPGVPVIMEFWPYAIKRSGVAKQEFVELVSGLFSKYYLVSDSGYTHHAIAEISKLFDQEDDPEKGTTVVLANKLIPIQS